MPNPKPVMSAEERRKRMFNVPGPGTYNHRSGLARKSAPFTKADRAMNFAEKTASPGPKYRPNTAVIDKASPKSKFGKDKRFQEKKANCGVVSYLDNKTVALQKPTNKFGKADRWKPAANKNPSPGPQYNPNVDYIKRNRKSGSNWGSVTEKRFSGTYTKPVNAVHTYTGTNAIQTHKQRSPIARFGKSKRDELSPKSISPAPKYNPSVNSDSRKKAAPAAGW
eukprot:CAMPEP_0184480978 /NCGR_PEP_ID=MMETSP0113_2-20130426/2521_1 /TAXON_ID=91329 /ORGANISM="Norrisiella sphaerica, Strain BC52" /LENGTH=222 /DNA_ID=CAMNT_0026859825 /DNA_START=238 /DNA_END=903 /DNA_ORIENTATION=-